MQEPSTAGWSQRAVGWALAALGFFLPFSTAGVSLALLALLLLAVATAPRMWALKPWRDPAVAIGLVLFAYIAVHTALASGIGAHGLSTVNKYHELLFLPLLVAAFRTSAGHPGFVRGLTLGTLGYAAAFWAAMLLPTLQPALDARRISAGFILGVWAFVLLGLSRQASRPALLRVVAAILAATVLFRIEGRTGHVVLLALLAVVAWTSAPRRWRLLATLALPLAGVLLASVSPAVQKRMGETMQVILEAQPDGETSTGIRIAVTLGAIGVAREGLPWGIGYGRYAEVHEPFVRQAFGTDPRWTKALKFAWVQTENPHNEYLMQLAGGGVIGLLLFLAWLGAQVVRRGPSEPSSILPGVVLAFAVAALFNSVLMDFMEGHFHMALLAWLLAREADRAPSTA